MLMSYQGCIDAQGNDFELITNVSDIKVIKAYSLIMTNGKSTAGFPMSRR